MKNSKTKDNEWWCVAFQQQNLFATHCTFKRTGSHIALNVLHGMTSEETSRANRMYQEVM